MIVLFYEKNLFIMMNGGMKSHTFDDTWKLALKLNTDDKQQRTKCTNNLKKTYFFFSFRKRLL